MLVAPQYSHHQRREVTTYSVASRERGALHCSIQQAIDKAEPFSRIVVSGGTYFESLTVTQPIELIGEEGDPPEITNRGVCLTVTADVECLFDNINFSSRTAAHGGMRRGHSAGQTAVRVVRGKPSFNRCTMTSMYAGGSSCPFVHKCLITGNSFGPGLVVGDDADGEYTSNTICNHLPYCVVVRSKSSPVFHENVIFQEPKTIAAMLAAAPFEGRIGGAVLVSWDGTDMDMDRSIRPKFTSNRIGETIIATSDSATSFVQMLPHTSVKSSRLVIGNEAVAEEVEDAAERRHGMAGLQQHLNIQQMSSRKMGRKEGSPKVVTVVPPLGGGSGQSTQQLFDKLNNRRGPEGSFRDMEERVSLLRDLLPERHVIKVDGGCFPIFEDNHITGGYVGVVVNSLGGGTFTNNQISQALLFGVQLHVDSSPVFTNNTIHSCATGMFSYASVATLRQNTIKECLGAGLVCALRPSHNGFISNNSTVGNDVGIIVLPMVAVTPESAALVNQSAMARQTAHRRAASCCTAAVVRKDTPTARLSASPTINTETKSDEGVGGTDDQARITGGMVCLNKSCGILVLGPSQEVVFSEVDIGSNGRAGAVFTMGCIPTVQKCRFERGTVAMVVEQASNPIVEDCLFSTHSDAAVIVRSHGKGIFTKCLFAAFGRLGVQVDDGGDPLMYDNVFGSITGTCVDVTCGGMGTFSRNSISDVSLGFTVSILGDPVIAFNTIKGATGCGIRVSDDGCGTVVGNVIQECTVGVSCGDGAVASIRSNEIERSVRTGIHALSGSECNIEKNSIRASGDVNILMEGEDNNCIVNRNRCSDSGGVGIQASDGATAHISFNNTSGNKGGGYRCDGGASTFLSNESSGDVGPGFVLGRGSGSTFTRCVATLSSACGLLVEAGSGSEVFRCRMVANEKEGIRVATASSSTISHCTIVSNVGPGILLVAPDAPAPAVRVHPAKKSKLPSKNEKVIVSKTSPPPAAVEGAKRTTTLRRLLVEANKGGGLVAEPNSGGTVSDSIFKNHFVDRDAEKKRALDDLPHRIAKRSKHLAFSPSGSDPHLESSSVFFAPIASVESEADPKTDTQLQSGFVLARVDQMSHEKGRGVGALIHCPRLTTVLSSSPLVPPTQRPPQPTVIEGCYFTGNDVGALFVGDEEGGSGRVASPRRGDLRRPPPPSELNLSTVSSTPSTMSVHHLSSLLSCRFGGQNEVDVAMVRGAHAKVALCHMGAVLAVDDELVASPAKPKSAPIEGHEPPLEETPPPSLMSPKWNEQVFLADFDTHPLQSSSSLAPSASPFGICCGSASQGIIVGSTLSHCGVAGAVFGPECTTEMRDSSIVACGVGAVCRNLSYPSIISNRITDSNVANVIVHWLSQPVIIHNLLCGCRSHGVVLCNRRGTFKKNEISRNGGHGVLVRASAPLPVGHRVVTESPPSTLLAVPSFSSTSPLNPARKRSSAAAQIANTAVSIQANVVEHNTLFGVLMLPGAAAELTGNKVQLNSSGGVSIGINTAVLVHGGNCIEFNLGLGGVRVEGGGDPIISDCQMVRNEPCGLRLEEGAAGCYEGNHIVANKWDGVIVHADSRAQLHRNTVAEHEKGAAFIIHGPSPELRITQGNIISANDSGIVAVEGSGASGFVNGNVFRHNRGVSVVLHAKSALLVTENRFVGCSCCVSLYEDAGGHLLSNHFSGNHEVIRILGGNISTICKDNALLDNKRGFVVCTAGGYRVEGNTFGPHEEAAVLVKGTGDCTVCNNIFQGGYAMRIEGECAPLVQNNTFFRCHVGITLSCFGVGGAVIQRNVFTLCDVGIVSQNFNHLVTTLTNSSSVATARRGSRSSNKGRRQGVSHIAHNFFLRSFTAGLHLRLPSHMVMGAITDTATSIAAAEMAHNPPFPTAEASQSWRPSSPRQNSAQPLAADDAPSIHHTLIQRNVFSENWYVPAVSCGILISAGGGIAARVVENDIHRNAVGIRGEGPMGGEIVSCVLHHNDIGCWLSGSSCVPELGSCMFYGNRTCGVCIGEFATPTVSNCLFREGAGTSSEAVFSATLVPCLPTGLQPSSEGAIVVGPNGGGDIISNLFRNCTTAVTLCGATRVQVTHNYVHGGSLGVLAKGNNRLSYVRDNYFLECEVGIGLGDGASLDVIEGNLLEACEVGLVADRGAHCPSIERNGVVRCSKTGILLRGGPAKVTFRQNVVEECGTNGVLQNYMAPLPLLVRSGSDSTLWTRGYDPSSKSRPNALQHLSPFAAIDKPTSRGVVLGKDAAPAASGTTSQGPPSRAPEPAAPSSPSVQLKGSPLLHVESFCTFEQNFIRHNDNNVSLQNGLITLKSNFIYGGNYGLLLKATHQQQSNQQPLPSTTTSAAAASQQGDIFDDLFALCSRNIVFENHKGGCLLGVKDPLNHLIMKGNQLYHRADGAVVLATTSTPPLSKENEVFNNCPFKQHLPAMLAPLKLATLRAANKARAKDGSTAVVDGETAARDGDVTTPTMDYDLAPAASPGVGLLNQRRLHRGVDISGVVCAPLQCTHTMELPEDVMVVPSSVFVGPDGTTLADQHLSDATYMDAYVACCPRRRSVAAAIPRPTEDVEEGDDHEVALEVQRILTSMQSASDVDPTTTQFTPRVPSFAVPVGSEVKRRVSIVGVLARTGNQAAMVDTYPTSLPPLLPGAVLKRFLGCSLMPRSFNRGEAPPGYRFEKLLLGDSRPSSAAQVPPGSPRGGNQRSLGGLSGVSEEAQRAAASRAPRQLVPRPPQEGGKTAAARTQPPTNNTGTKSTLTKTAPVTKRAAKTKKTVTNQ